jgi:hypothetical protein
MAGYKAMAHGDNWKIPSWEATTKPAAKPPKSKVYASIVSLKAEKPPFWLPACVILGHLSDSATKVVEKSYSKRLDDLEHQC